MEEEAEVFTTLPGLAWEDSDNDFINTGNRKAALHSTRSDLEGRDLVVGLTTLIVLMVVVHSLGYGAEKSDRCRGTTHTFSSCSECGDEGTDRCGDDCQELYVFDHSINSLGEEANRNISGLSGL